MEMTSKEIRAKIQTLKSELSRTKEYYKNQIYTLKQRETWAKSMSSMMIGAKSSEKNGQKLQTLNEQISALEKERDEKVKPIEKELETLKKTYRDNYDKYKAEDKKAKQDRINDWKIFFDSHKIQVILSGIGICLVLVFIIGVVIYGLGVAYPDDFVGLTVNEATALAEKVGLESDVWGSAYDPEARDEQTVDSVSALYNSDGSQDYSYNKYTDGKKRLLRGSKISFEVRNYSKKQQEDIETCKNSEGNPDYKIEGGKVVCYQKETEEEKKSKCEATGKWYRDGLCKSQEEWETKYKWEDAHAACKKYGVNAYAKTLTDCYVGSDYMGTVDGQPANNSSNSSSSSSEGGSGNSNSGSSSSDSGASYKWNKFNDDGTCSSNVKFCVAIDESVGYAAYNYGNVKGRIYNNTGENASYVQVSYSVYNSAGAKIGDCFDNVSGLNAGTTWAYDAYCTAWDSGVTIKDVELTWW